MLCRYYLCYIVDALPWVELMVNRLKHWRTHDVEVAKSTALATVFIEVWYSHYATTFGFCLTSLFFCSYFKFDLMFPYVNLWNFWCGTGTGTVQAVRVPLSLWSYCLLLLLFFLSPPAQSRRHEN